MYNQIKIIYERTYTYKYFCFDYKLVVFRRWRSRWVSGLRPIMVILSKRTMAVPSTDICDPSHCQSNDGSRNVNSDVDWRVWIEYRKTFSVYLGIILTLLSFPILFIKNYYDIYCVLIIAYLYYSTFIKKYCIIV